MKDFFKIILLMFFTTLFTVGCSPKLAPAEDKDTSWKPFYPKPPDTAKLQYLTKFDRSADIEKKQSSFKSKIVGAQQGISIGKPYGVEIKNGKVYVCDLSGQIVIIDLVQNRFSSFKPKGNASFNLPVNMSIDDENNLYVVDIKGKNVKAYNAVGVFQGTVGMNELVKPTDVVVKNNKIFVCDIDNNRINIYDKTTKKLLNYFPDTTPESEDWLFSPANIFVTNNEVYVSDMGASNIKVFTHEGEYIRKVGSFGKQMGNFARVKGISVDKEENLYAVDGAFQNVQIFNKKGEILMFFGENNGLKGSMILPTDITIDYDNLEYFQKYVDSNFTLKYIILVANQYGNKITVYGRVDPK